ncbi:MAG: hypothetical protein DBY32_01670 [Phascolarctobacterium sp.]|nr:MAG: hypothetical protein DBY32_01670 [Phascolarctobacterium sp.]
MLKKLLVAIDGTEYSWRALEYAMGIAKLNDAEMVVLTVAKDGLQHTPQLPLESELAGTVNEPAMQIGNDVLGAAKHMVDQQQIPCSYTLVIGSRPAPEIIKCCRKEHCDTIIIGTRGFGAIEGLFKNSVSQTVIENASVPVIVIK